MNTSEPPGGSTRSRRLRLLVDVALVVVAGLVVHVGGVGIWFGLAGDALYAAMAYLLIAIVFPRAPVTRVATSAFMICAIIELFQLSGLPALWAESFWPARLVFGAGFDPLDLIAYAVGAAAAAGYDAVLSRAGFGVRASSSR